VKPFEILGREKTPEGDELILARRGGIYHLTIEGEELMTSRAHGSEQALARLACEALGDRKAPRVLVSGLGFGYTLRAALDRLPKNARVVVCEVFASLIEWHRGELGDLAGRPLEDRRVKAVRADVRTLFDGREVFDAILLDVDNGPEAFTLRSNEHLYSPEGIARLGRRLEPGGILAVWSSSSAPKFQDRLRRAGFEAWTKRVSPRDGAGRRSHTIFLARRLDAARRRP